MRENNSVERALAVDRFVESVKSKLRNCVVYFDFYFTVSSFSVGVMALTAFNGNVYFSHYITSHMSFGLDDFGIEREANDVSDYIARELGLKMYLTKTDPIPEELFKTVKRMTR